MPYTREQVIRAAVELAQLEIEHESDFEMIFKRDGIELEHVAPAATAVAHSTLEHRLNKEDSMSEKERGLTFAATMAAFVRGFATAQQLRRARADS